MGDVIYGALGTKVPPSPDSAERGTPAKVLPLRDRLYERIFEEAWAERIAQQRAQYEPRPRLRLRLVRRDGGGE
jgi:hypothetical protein